MNFMGLFIKTESKSKTSKEIIVSGDKKTYYYSKTETKNAKPAKLAKAKR
jgi:hypothetical protein